MVHCGFVGPAHHSAVWRCDDDDFPVADIIFHLSGHQDDSNSGRSICHDLQCRIWILLGSHPLVVPPRDSSAQHSVQGCVLVDGDQLGMQLAGWRDDAHPARMDRVAPVPGSCVFLCEQFRHW